MNTEAENSMKLNFLSTLGVNSMRMVKNDHKKPATTTAKKNHQPKGKNQGPTSVMMSVFIAARMESKMKSHSVLTVYSILPFRILIESTNNLTAMTSIIAKTI